MRGCSTEGHPTNRAADNADLKATFGDPETNTGFRTTRDFDIYINKTDQRGNILAGGPESGPGENWISLCFNTGGFCQVTVAETNGVSVITFLGSDPTSKVRVVDTHTSDEQNDVLSCSNSKDVTITLNRSVGWSTN